MTDEIWQQPTIKVAGPDPAASRAAYKSGWPVGATVDGRYKVLEIRGGPGISGMGVVYVVEFEGRRFAAKTFQRQFAQDLPLIQRFLIEARTWMLLGFHPNIASAFGLDIIEATPYLIMEYVPSDATGALSLADHLSRGPLDPARAVDLALQCCDGMRHATAAVPGLVHRDLKPENLLITPDGTLKITDFGLVRCRINQQLRPSASDNAATAAAATQLTPAMGTPAYMAPEQFTQGDDVTQRADLYAFGCCFYEVLTGRHIFEFRRTAPIVRALHAHLNEQPLPLLEHALHCPKELSHTIMRCLEKDPERRWSGFDEVYDRLRFVLKKHYGEDYVPRSVEDPSPRDVARQLRALSLLDGYQRAIGMRHLRSSHTTSPYAFHLALASYFHCNDEPREERRQLEKALRVRAHERGDEAVRRLAEHMLEAHELDEADSLLKAFLNRNPDALHLVLDPYVRLLIARGELEQAEASLRAAANTLRTERLWGLLYQASQRHDEWAGLLRRRAEAILTSLRNTVATLQPSERVGWDLADDPALLKDLLAHAAPELDTAILDSLDHTFWPDVTAYPDFSGDMAWLSEVCGELAHLPDAVTDDERATCSHYADLLGFPQRLKRYLERDEAWLWFTLDEEGLPPAS